MSTRLFALVDVNNCYVSCERVFNPALNDKPVVVLSNNDGCVVSRSQETKTLGVKMGIPWFQLEPFAQEHGVIALSSNYALYAAMSNRFHQILQEAVTPEEHEIYSIDEGFLELTAYQTADTRQWAEQLRQQIRQWLGLPVCVGIGFSKTQAKLANHIAKKYPAFNGVCHLGRASPTRLQHWYAKIPASEVWGVGRESVQKLAQLGISSVADLAQSNASSLGRHFSVLMDRTIRELNGEACYTLDTMPAPRQQILCSRSFGQLLNHCEPLEEAVRYHVQNAVKKLRTDRQLCQLLIVFVKTSRFRTQDAQVSLRQAVRLNHASDDLCYLTGQAVYALRQMYQSGYNYKKAGVILADLTPCMDTIPDLFAETSPNRTRLGHTLDDIFKKYGRQAIRVGAVGQPAGQRAAWEMTCNRRTPNYLGNWDELMTVD